MYKPSGFLPMKAKKSPLSEAQILNGGHPVQTKHAGKGFGQGAVVQSADTDVAATVKITNVAQPETVETETEETVEPVVENAGVTREEIQALLNDAIAGVKQQVETVKAEAEEAQQKLSDEQTKSEQTAAELEALKNDLEAKKAEKAELEKELQTAKNAKQSLEELGKLVNTNTTDSAPKPMEVLGEGSEQMRRWQQMLQSAPTAVVQHAGGSFAQKDRRAANEYLHQNRAAVRGGIEAMMRDAGLLQGAGASVVTNAPTLMADIPSASFDYLSEMIRIPSDNDLIYWQFARSYSVPGVAPRFQGQVPRYPYQGGPATKASRTLTPGTDLNAARQAVAEKLTPVDILELGLGKDASNSAIALTRFVEAFSLNNLEEIVMRNLGRDYQRTKDLFLRSEWAAATTIVYNNANAIATIPGDVVDNSIGTLTRGFLRSLFAYMRTAKIPTYSNGMYVLTVNPNQLNYLLTELAEIQRYPEPTSSELEMISRVLQVEDAAKYGGPVSGYRLATDGFMIFEQNVHSVGADGDEGVQEETTGATTAAQLTETCYAAGADSICWATALPVEMIEDEVTDFRRRRSFIWYSHENSAPLDVNFNGTTGQETRVIKCNMTRLPV